MKASTRRVLRFLLSRASESATWRGVALMATVAGAKISPEHTEAIVLLGLFVSGLLGAAFPDKIERNQNVDQGDPR